MSGRDLKDSPALTVHNIEMLLGRTTQRSASITEFFDIVLV